MATEVPIPPAELTARIAQRPPTADDKERYLEGGRESRRAIERVLPDDWNWAGKRILDFGCGAGRTIRHFIDLAPDCELWGCDISAPCIRLGQSTPEPARVIRLQRCGPPLPFPAGTFDLIYAVSVFTHITHQWAAWLLELDRILTPDARLIATFMGEGMCAAVTGEPGERDEHRHERL